MTSSADEDKTKRPHMVTEGYLAAWADGGKIIDVIDVQLGKGYQSSIANASVVKYVYRTEVLGDTLERRYAAIESDGISAMRKLIRGITELAPREFESIIAFIDMHRHRGRYADRAGKTLEAMTASVNLTSRESMLRETKLTLGDMLPLIHQHPDTLRLTDLHLETWDWNVVGSWEQLISGDGAALVWNMDPNSDRITSVTFPISPTQLLIIGEDIPDTAMPNVQMLVNCRRWVFGQKGTLPRHKAAELARLRRKEEA